MNNQQELTGWLLEAYAMERSTETSLMQSIDNNDTYPVLKKGYEEHLEKTKSHIYTLRACIEKRGASPSSMTSDVLRGIEVAKKSLAALQHDAELKNLKETYINEHREIITYRLLILAAKKLGEEEIGAACQSILKDEEEMAQWLEEQIEATVGTYLSLEPDVDSEVGDAFSHPSRGPEYLKQADPQN